MTELASLLTLHLGLGGPFPSNSALGLETAGLLLGLERPVVAASLVGRQPGGGGGEGAAQVLEGAGHVRVCAISRRVIAHRCDRLFHPSIV